MAVSRATVTSEVANLNSSLASLPDAGCLKSAAGTLRETVGSLTSVLNTTGGAAHVSELKTLAADLEERCNRIDMDIATLKSQSSISTNTQVHDSRYGG